MHKTLTFEYQVEMDDVLSQLSLSEQEELYNTLKSEIEPDDPDDEEDYPTPVSIESAKSALLREAVTFYEEEVTETLFNIWENRHLLTPNQRQRLVDLSKERFI